MINPNRMHRARAVVLDNKGSCQYKVKLDKTGHELIGFDLPAKIKPGDVVNIQARYSIMLDQYVIKTINKVRKAA